jgi:hypothetical protein
MERGGFALIPSAAGSSGGRGHPTITAGCRWTPTATAHGDAPDSEVMGTLDAIRRLVERSV